MTANQIKYWELNERIRSNKASEHETVRSHLASESETRRSNIAKEAETHRSNVEKEIETATHNRNTERETQRSNLAKEETANYQATISDRHQQEQVRHNKIDEALKTMTVANQGAKTITDVIRIFGGK